MRRVVAVAAVLAACGVVIAALAAAGWVVAVAHSAGNISRLKPHWPHPPTEIFASDGSLIGYVQSDTVFERVPENKIPARMKQAIVAIEDRRFWQHGALDFQGILRAGIKDVPHLLQGGSAIQGASTLTMQLVDNVYMPKSIRHHRDLRYKIYQAEYAIQLAKAHSKEWILDNYINDVPFGTVNGETAIGVGAAARSFFDKPLWKLNLAQMSLLAGLPQAPYTYNPFRNPQVAKQRRHDVLQAMVSSQYISQSLADAVDRQPLQIRANSTYLAHQEPFAFDYVLQQLTNKFCPKNPNPLKCTPVKDGGLKVYTTIDVKMQQWAREAIANHAGGTQIYAQPGAALASVDPSNGHIMAIGQSAPYGFAKGRQTNFDYAVNAHRQSGSAFKVFALMTLIHDYNGDPNQTYYTSRPLPAGWLPVAPTWEVHTAEGSYVGRISITRATIASDNTVFAQLSTDLNDQFSTPGWDKMDTLAHQMGISSDTLHGNPSEVLGGLSPGVTPLDMAVASATIANGGWHIPPTIIDHIVFPDGKSLPFASGTRTKVFTDGETAAAIAVLKGVVTSGTGTPANYGCPAAGKTGTANDHANAWFVGFTPRLSTAVWVGYPQGNFSMANFGPGYGFGGPTAGPIWRDFMMKASKGYCGDWPAPTTAWSGTAYSGPHSSANVPSCPSAGSTPSTSSTASTPSSTSTCPPTPNPNGNKPTKPASKPGGGNHTSGGQPPSNPGTGGSGLGGGSGGGNGHGGGSGHGGTSK